MINVTLTVKNTAKFFLSLSIASVFLGGFVYFVFFTRIWANHKGFILSISLITLSIAGSFITFGIHTFHNRTEALSKWKNTILVLGMIFMFAFPFLSHGMTSFIPYFTVDEVYLWNDGPYVTFGEDPTAEMAISWLTGSPTKTEILFGPTPDALEPLSTDDPRSHMHHFYLSDLTPNTTYYYKINRNFVAQHESDVFSFTTAPSGDSDFEIVIVGDMQPTWFDTLKTGNIVAQGIVDESPDFIVQLGDICSSGAMSQIWHMVLRNFPLFAANAPFQAVIGNHEYAGGGQENSRILFPYPYESTDGLYYSFDYGNVHFIMLDNFNAGNSKMTDSQKLWAEQDIIDAKSRGQKWIFVCFHHTILTTGTSSQNWDLQSWMVPIADKYDIDGVFFGHDHHYEHWNYTYGATGLLHNETDAPSGNETHYWCSGGGGAHLEVDYGVLTHEPWTNQRYFYNVSAAEYQYIPVIRNPWNSSRYVNSDTHKIYADGELYYHSPDRESYSTDNVLYGYQYGEQTLHYMKLEISNNGNTCTISAYYPNGDLMTGPDGLYHQTWTFTK